MTFHSHGDARTAAPSAKSYLQVDGMAAYPPHTHTHTLASRRPQTIKAYLQVEGMAACSPHHRAVITRVLDVGGAAVIGGPATAVARRLRLRGSEGWAGASGAVSTVLIGAHRHGTTRLHGGMGGITMLARSGAHGRHDTVLHTTGRKSPHRTCTDVLKVPTLDAVPPADAIHPTCRCRTRRRLPRSMSTRPPHASA